LTLKTFSKPTSSTQSLTLTSGRIETFER